MDQAGIGAISVKIASKKIFYIVIKKCEARNINGEINFKFYASKCVPLIYSMIHSMFIFEDGFLAPWSI